MPLFCPCCKHDLDPQEEYVERGKLRVTFNPAGAQWDGNWLWKGRPAQTRILATLVRTGKATRDHLIGQFSEDYEEGAFKVMLSHLRANLRNLGIPVSIDTDRGWGYRLVIEDDHKEKNTLHIAGGRG